MCFFFQSGGEVTHLQISRLRQKMINIASGVYINQFEEYRLLTIMLPYFASIDCLLSTLLFRLCLVNMKYSVASFVSSAYQWSILHVRVNRRSPKRKSGEKLLLFPLRRSYVLFGGTSTASRRSRWWRSHPKFRLTSGLLPNHMCIVMFVRFIFVLVQLHVVNRL